MTDWRSKNNNNSVEMTPPGQNDSFEFTVYNFKGIQVRYKTSFVQLTGSLLKIIMGHSRNDQNLPQQRKFLPSREGGGEMP